MNKATFRAIREAVGLSQSDLAALVDVSTTAVKRWEHPDGPEPPADAIDELLTWKRAHDEAVETAVDTALRSAEKLGRNADLPPVVLTYFKSQESFDHLGRDAGPFGVVNARSRAVAANLERLGFEVSFAYPGESPAADAANTAR